MQDVLLLWRKITRGREKENGAKRRNPVSERQRKTEQCDVILTVHTGHFLTPLYTSTTLRRTSIDDCCAQWYLFLTTVHKLSDKY